MTSSCSHPAIWGNKVVWLEHKDLDLDRAGLQADRWWSAPYSIAGEDITDPNCPKLICIVKAQGQQWQPAIDGDLVAYVDDADNGRIKVCRLVAVYAPVELHLQGNASGLGPAVWAGTIVWQGGGV